MNIQYNTLNELIPFQLIHIGTNHNKNFFKAHRHDFYEMVYITEGCGKHSIDFKAHELTANTLHLIQPSSVHEWLLEEFQGEYDGYIFLFSKELLPNVESLHSLFHFNTSPVIQLTQPIQTHIDQLIDMIQKEEHSQSQLLRLLFSSVLEYVVRLKKACNETSTQDQRIPKLLELIEKNFIEQKSAAFYAKVLDLTPKRLNELTKQYLQKTVSSLIVDRNIIEAKRELFYSNVSIKNISEILGFNDTAHFVKFFKKHTSYTPTEFKTHIKKLPI
jgi:AraC-like DNA-binding protein